MKLDQLQIAAGIRLDSIADAPFTRTGALFAAYLLETKLYF
uniref:Uncharacterized protein n=1 Tax=Arundo donax TaxID=35708 RepID=A0A0A9H2I9_ARUDO